MNNFEKHLRNNRKQLESKEVNPQIWLSIENEILRTKEKRKTIYLKIVSIAAVIILGLFIATFGLLGSSNNLEKDLLSKYDLEKYNFPEQVHVKKATLASAMIPSTKQEDFKVLLQQLEFLDEQYNDYLAYIEKNGYQKFIGEQILNYYKSKIELLDKIQSEIGKINYYEKKFPSNEKKVELEI
ncbi:MAG: hypothetical protein AB8F94_00485 [Saprospiraceae bacterium]